MTSHSNEKNSIEFIIIEQKFYKIDQNWTKFNGKVGNSMLVNDSEQNFLSNLIPFNGFRFRQFWFCSSFHNFTNKNEQNPKRDLTIKIADPEMGESAITKSY